MRPRAKHLRAPHPPRDRGDLRHRTVLEGPGSELEWQIGTDRYVSLAVSAKQFATHMVPDLSAIYSALSGYSHPSLRFLSELLVEEATPDGMRTVRPGAPIPRTVRRQCWMRPPDVSLMTLLFSYLGGPQDRLEAPWIGARR